MSFWNKTAGGRTTRSTDRNRAPRRRPSPGALAEQAFEALEARTLMYTTPFLAGPPSLSLMQNPSDTVVRLDTTLGYIDIELYDAAATAGGTTATPVTVANFLKYVNDGDFDETFFHRSAKGGGGTNFVIQLGGFSFDDLTGLAPVAFNVSGTGISVTASDSSINTTTRGQFTRISVGDRIITSGFATAANNGTFTVLRKISDQKIIIQAVEPLVDEAAGAAVKIDSATIIDDPGKDSDGDGKADSRSNLLGTLAMARRGDNPFTTEDESKDSATSQFFFNMTDNSFLDSQGFTVFGRVIGVYAADISAVFSTSDGSSFQSSDPGRFSSFKVGDRIGVDGFATAANNGLFTITHVTGQEIFVTPESGTDLTNESADPERTVLFSKCWAPVLDIAALPVHDYTDIDHTSQTPLPGADENSYSLREVPVRGTVPDGSGLPHEDLNELNLIVLNDVEVIKAVNADRFYGEVLYYPEGWRGNTIKDTVHLVNTDVNSTTYYQIIARFETGHRDVVITSGSLTAGARTSIRISDYSDALFIPHLDQNRGYSYEIRCTPRPPNAPGGATSALAASLEHVDFGARAEESFISVGQLQTSALTHWGFGGARKGVGEFPFVFYQNLSKDVANVYVTFYTAAGSFSSAKAIEGNRRGGLNINQVVPPESAPQALKDAWAAGVPFSMLLTSDKPIVAAMSQYTTTATVPPSNRASTAAGIVGGSLSAGYLAAARIPTGGQATVSLFYTQPSPAIVFVDFEFFLQDGTHLFGNPVLLTPGQRVDYNLATANPGLTANQFFSIRYGVRAGAAPIAAQYNAVDGLDAVSTPFSIISSNTQHFADLFLDPTSSPTQYNEYISILNPYSDPTVTMTYRIRFHFAHSSTPSDILFDPGAQGSLLAGRRVDVNLRALLLQLVPRIQSDARFRSFSATVDATVLRGGSSFTPSAMVTQVTRVDTLSGQSSTSLGTLDAGRTAIFMNDASLAGAIAG